MGRLLWQRQARNLESLPSNSHGAHGLIAPRQVLPCIKILLFGM